MLLNGRFEGYASVAYLKQCFAIEQIRLVPNVCAGAGSESTNPDQQYDPTGEDERRFPMSESESKLFFNDDEQHG
jgi:hypothetical protein